MITLIGTTHTTIGFGLCGIKDIHEVKLECDSETLNVLVRQAKNDVIMIDELLKKKLTIKTDKTIITIPYRNGSADTTFIENLMKNTIGVVKSWEE